MFFLQTLFLMALAFGLGCLCGCWLKGRFGRPRHHSGAASAITQKGAVRTATAGELAAQWPHYEPASTPQRVADLPPGPVAVPEPVVAPEAGAVAPAAVAPIVPAKAAAKPKAAGSAARKAVAIPAAAKPAAAKTAGAKAAAILVASKPPKPLAEKPAALKAAPAKPAAAKAVKSAPAKPAKARPEAAAVPDNLKQIKGVGPQIEGKLNAAGINSFAQIAAWTKKDQAEFGEQPSFAGRIEREQWVTQAKILAKGGSTEFAKRVARGEVESSGGKPKPGGGK